MLSIIDNAKKQWIRLFILAAFVAMTGAWIPNVHEIWAAENVSPQVGYKAPDFTLDSLTAKKINLYQVINKNRVTLINFWGIWCPYCVREIPELVRFYQKYHPRKVEIVAVDAGDNPRDIPSFAKDNQMSFPILIDKNNEISNLYQIAGFPTTIIIDRQSKIRDIIVGATNQSVLAAKVEAILREK
jgi:peroxiredoxin